ncbi:MAG: ABC transporter substrate-binding protein [Pseudomonadota bacterium]
MTLNRRTVLKGGAALGAATLATPYLARAAAHANKEWILRGSIPLTGPFAQAGVDGLKNTQDWVEMKNASGGIAGKQVNLQYEDSGYNPTTSLANFKKTMSDDVKPHFYSGDSTGFMKLVQPELSRTPVLNGGTSFATDLADPANSPYQFITGPTYNAMAEINMKYIAQQGGKRVAFVYSDNEYGRDPIEHAKKIAAEQGLEVVHEEVTDLQGAEVQTHVAQVRRSNPDHIFIHGYVTSVWPQIIGTARAFGMDAKFVGTFWGMELVIARTVQEKLGDALDGYAGVMPYRYFYEAAESPAYQELAAFKTAKYGDEFPGYITTWSLQGLATLALLEKVFTDVTEADIEPTPENLSAALGKVQGWDSGGYFGLPVNVDDHAINQARVYQYSAEKSLFLPVSDTIEV